MTRSCSTAPASRSWRCWCSLRQHTGSTSKSHQRVNKGGRSPRRLCPGQSNETTQVHSGLSPQQLANMLASVSTGWLGQQAQSPWMTDMTVHQKQMSAEWASRLLLLLRKGVFSAKTGVVVCCHACRPSSVQGLSAKELLYEVKQPMTASGQHFALTVTRKATGQPVFNTQGHR